jgi:hypothetical protein
MPDRLNRIDGQCNREKRERIRFISEEVTVTVPFVFKKLTVRGLDSVYEEESVVYL